MRNPDQKSTAPCVAPRASRHRSRRLRKKLHIEEFREAGFHVDVVLNVEPGAANHRFWDAFLAEAIEAHALTCGGAYSCFVTPERGSATEAHRRIVRDWLAARPEVTQVTVGGLVDAWYGDATVA